MFKCWEFNSSSHATSTKPTSSSSSGNRHRSSRQRKFVSYESGSFAGNNSKLGLLLVLFLVLSIHCAGLAECSQVSPSSGQGLGKTSSSSGKDGGSGGAVGSRASSSVSVDDGELSSSSSHHHHNHHNYHRHHRHGSSGKNVASSTASASYGYQQPEHSPLLSYYNPDAYYEPRYYDRPSREFSARSTSYPAMAAAASNTQVGFAEPEYGGLALASGHGGGHGHGGIGGIGGIGGGGGGAGGHGHGHDPYGHHTTYYKTVNKLDQSSLGLLGLLGLLSLLSNVLMLLTTTAATTTMMMAAAGRSLRLKRDTMMLVKLKDEADEQLSRRSVVERLSRLILPSLNVVGHAKDGRIPLNCTYQEVCKTNKALVQVFGADEGRPVASVLSTAITKLLTNNAEAAATRRNSQKHQHHRYNSFVRENNGYSVVAALAKKLLMGAGAAGRNGEDCELIYPTCDALSEDKEVDDYSTNNGIKKSGGKFRLPFLVSPEHALAIILGQGGTTRG